MENNLLIVLVIILILVISFGLFVIYQKLSRPQKNEMDTEALQLLQSQLNQLNNFQSEKLDRLTRDINDRLRDQDRTLNEQLQKSNTSIQQQFAISQKSLIEYTNKIKGITEEITKVGETGKNIQGFAEQLQSLENILRNPKQRGVLGEYYLETVLKNVLPPEAFRLQYKFKNAEIVDSIVITRDGFIPIDAKFSLENYNRMATAETKDEREKLEKVFKQDLMHRIDETSKYIRPEEGTLDFAFMFIPADGVYYDLLVQKVGVVDVNQAGLLEYAFKKRVMIVSPTTFFAYLQTVLQGLRALRIEESTKEIQVQVGKLQRHLNAYVEFHSKVGKSLNTTVNQYNAASKELLKVDKDVLKISGGTGFSDGIEAADSPSLELSGE